MKKSKKQTKVTSLGIRITPDTKKKLDWLCKNMDRSQSWIVSNLVEKEYEKQKR